MHLYVVGVDASAAGEESGGAEHHGELTGLVLSIPPAVRCRHQPGVGQERGTAHRCGAVCQADH